MSLRVQDPCCATFLVHHVMPNTFAIYLCISVSIKKVSNTYFINLNSRDNSKEKNLGFNRPLRGMMKDPRYKKGAG